MRKAVVIMLLSDARAQIVWGAADGSGNETIAAQLGLDRVQVGRWRTRYAEGGLAAIEKDLPHGGRSVKIDAAQLVQPTTQTSPSAGTHWCTRSLAAKVGVSTPRCCGCGVSTG